MPRIRQYAQKYANEDFFREVSHRKIEVGIKSDRELAERIGLAGSGYCKRKQNPENISVAELRRLIQVLCPDPVILLKFLGYSGKAIPKNLTGEEETQ